MPWHCVRGRGRSQGVTLRMTSFQVARTSPTIGETQLKAVTYSVVGEADRTVVVGAINLVENRQAVRIQQLEFTRTDQGQWTMKLGMDAFYAP